MAAKFTLFWSTGQKTYILRRPGNSSIKFGNLVPYGVILQEAGKIAKEANAQLVIKENK